MTRIWPGARVGPQQVAGDVHVERVPEIARRMVRGDIEHLEVGQVVLDLGPLVHHEAELAEDLGDGLDRLGDRMQRSAPDRPAGSVTSTFSAASRRAWTWALSSAPRAASAPLTASPTSLAIAPTRGRSSAGKRADPAQDGSQVALLAEVLDLKRFQGCGIGRGGNLRQGPLLQLSQIGAQAVEVHAAVLTCPRALPAGMLQPRI